MLVLYVTVQNANSSSKNSFLEVKKNKNKIKIKKKLQEKIHLQVAKKVANV